MFIKLSKFLNGSSSTKPGMFLSERSGSSGWRFSRASGARSESFHAPFVGRSLWWRLAPVLASWPVLESYLDRHKGERLGWNTAPGNAINFFWISLAGDAAALQRAARRNVPARPVLRHPADPRVRALRRLHLLRPQARRTSRIRAGVPLVIYYLCVFAILRGNEALDVNRYFLFAAVLLFGVVYGLRGLFFWPLPDTEGPMGGDK